MSEERFQPPGPAQPLPSGLNSGGMISSPSQMLPPSLERSPGRGTAKVPGPGEMKDGTRELVETIVFVVVLVLLLKTFLAEAFVIPTGSMATTLLGYHQDVTCEVCGYGFLVNASSEGEGSDNKAFEVVTKCFCPNCQHLNVLRPPLPPGDYP